MTEAINSIALPVAEHPAVVTESPSASAAVIPLAVAAENHNHSNLNRRTQHRRPYRRHRSRRAFPYDENHPFPHLARFERIHRFPELGWYDIWGRMVYIQPTLPGCFNCGGLHHYNRCPLPQMHFFCAKCGLRNITVKDCPRHGGSWRMAGPFVKRLQRNVPWDIFLNRRRF